MQPVLGRNDNLPPFTFNGNRKSPQLYDLHDGKLMNNIHGFNKHEDVLLININVILAKNI